MKDETFDRVWEQINESAEAIYQRLKPEGHDFRFTYRDRGKKIICKEYDKIRRALKSRCYEPPVDPETGGHLIDHHKIAACFCKALIDNKLFSFEMDEKVSGEMVRSNYELAYTVSLRIVYDYLVESLKNEGKEELKERLKASNCLQVPTTTPSHEDYNLGRIKALALNDFYHMEFDLLAYSDMMFWIELYNRQILTGEIKVKFPERREAGTTKTDSKTP